QTCALPISADLYPRAGLWPVPARALGREQRTDIPRTRHKLLTARLATFGHPYRPGALSTGAVSLSQRPAIEQQRLYAQCRHPRPAVTPRTATSAYIRPQHGRPGCAPRRAIAER